MNDREFVDSSLELYRRYNENKLYYNGYDYYNKLLTADPFYITQEEYKTVKQNGKYLWDWLEEQKNLFNELDQSPSLKWLKEAVSSSISSHAYDYQQLINKKIKNQSRIIRADLSSFPFGCHEAQLRWGIVGHTHYISQIFNDTIPGKPGEIIFDESLANNIQNIIDGACTSDNECCVFLMSQKYREEMLHFGKLLTKTIPTLVSDFNENNFEIKNGSLVHKATGAIVRIVFRKELTLETLSQTEFGRKIVDLYLDQSIDFEPGLNLINDGKVGMALAFDERTKSLFSDASRKLFLKTSMFDERMESFNNVFGTSYANYDDFLQSCSSSKRNYVFKYGGFNLMMSFGASQVFRLDRSNGVTKEIIDSRMQLPVGNKEWIVQEFDHARYDVRFLKGDYNNRDSECSIEVSKNCPARFMLFYMIEDGEVRLINALANFVNDYWKARFKDSNSQSGAGAIVSCVRVKAD